MNESSELHRIGIHHGTDKATFHGYLDFYADQLPGRDFTGRLLEIGVMDGASLEMWRDYYPDAELILGVDVNRCRMIKDVRLVQADATDPDDVMEIVEEWGPFDVIIDDGSHMTRDQQTTFDLLFPHLNRDGVYVLEDLHTSYLSNYHNAQVRTVDFLAMLQLDVTWFRRDHQGGLDPFIRRHGFDPDTVSWHGAGSAQSITAVIRYQQQPTHCANCGAEVRSDQPHKIGECAGPDPVPSSDALDLRHPATLESHWSSRTLDYRRRDPLALGPVRRAVVITVPDSYEGYANIGRWLQSGGHLPNQLRGWAAELLAAALHAEEGDHGQE